MAVTTAVLANKGFAKICEDDIWEALNGQKVRKWLLDQKEELREEYDDLRTKKSLNALHEDSDTIDNLCSTLETKGPDSPDPPAPKVKIVVNLSSDEAV
ncbi:unnamed protein product [Peniophora sp. CBMAI 1063]|nr:unnamed protein product [Peniophora sp. CBMAI 1063]